jgi:hypothetical protein
MTIMATPALSAVIVSAVLKGVAIPGSDPVNWVGLWSDGQRAQTAYKSNQGFGIGLVLYVVCVFCGTPKEPKTKAK